MSYYVVTCAPAKEAEAKAILTRLGYDVTLPVEHVWRRFGKVGKAKLTDLVLTPRYLFVRHADFRSQIYRLRTALHCRQGHRIITGYLSYANGEPKPLDAVLVDALASLALKVESAAGRRSFKPGDQVTTKPGFIGYLLDTKGDRAQVLVVALGRENIVFMDVNALEAA